MKDIKKVGAIGGKTVAFYMATTAFAVSIGLLISNLLKGSFKVLETSGLEGVALIVGVDRIFDMGRTVCNITGDAACATVVNALEEKKEKRATA